MSDNSYIFCYWDDIGDSQDHVDNQEKNHFNYFNNHAASAKTRTDGMALLYKQIKAQEDRQPAKGSGNVICELRTKSCRQRTGETEGERNS